MIVDKLLTFTGASGQAITSAATTATTDHIDLGPLATGNTGRNIGLGKQMFAVLSLRAGSVTTVSNPTAQITIQVDDNTSFSSAATLVTSAAVALPTTSGTLAGNDLKVLIVLPLHVTSSYERYLRAQIITGGTITTASYTFDLQIVEAAQVWEAKADALDV